MSEQNFSKAERKKIFERRGEPMDKKAFLRLISFVKDYLVELGLNDSDEFEKVLVAVSKKIEADFKFAEQGAGVATVSRQLEKYQNSLENGVPPDPKEYDCKLPTVVLGMICLDLSDKYGLRSVRLLVSEKGVHPHLILKMSSEMSYLIDFRLLKFNSKFSDSDALPKSKFSIRSYDGNKNFDKNVLLRTISSAEELELTVDGIAELDKKFLYS